MSHLEIFIVLRPRHLDAIEALCHRLSVLPTIDCDQGPTCEAQLLDLNLIQQ